MGSEYSDAASFGPMECGRIGPSHAASVSFDPVRVTKLRSAGNPRLDDVAFASFQRPLYWPVWVASTFVLPMPNAAGWQRKAHALGRKLLSELDTLVAPDTCCVDIDI